MTLKQVLWDGQTNGATATSALLTGNSGYTVTAPSTITFSTADGMRGTTGLRVNVGTATAIVRYDMNADNDIAAFSLVFTMPASAPGAFAQFFSVRTGSGRAASLGISTNGRLYVADAGASGGTITYVTPTAGTLAYGSQYRVELRLQGNSTTAGKINCAVYSPSSTSSAIATMTPVTNANLTAATLHQVEIGNSGPTAISVGLEDLQMDDGRTTEIGPVLVPLAAPSVTAGTTTNPSATGATDGSQVVLWAAVANAASYDAYKATNTSPAQSDFALVASNVTSPYTFTGLGAGPYAFGIMAKP
ncbi:hypothetical protein [Leifsonia sp. 1010]|uniref:hypothetical protein n=1 Tax=Leifsonia sp. 1010 TaxID=2817769 RepID=UPI0028603278|nr:hypothetical protein [Leifsonia sp. 1010]MDR6613600.1 hypothetical protein [Leifsonia sp. 1010]